jgi:hypothetical protein
MTEADNGILDDLFQACALTAFLEQAQAEQNWPNSEATRRRAYQLYEEALADRNRERPLRAGDVCSQSLTIPAKCATVES